MKLSVIICEFNPLHYGHKRLIDFAKTFSDKVVCVMSGNFTQRGMPAVCNKYKRAAHALQAGADLVVELPTVFATSSAENFALGGVQIANALHADFLVFGSECGNVELLKQCAERLEEDKVNEEIRLQLKRGVSYPKAVATACETDILNKPNNVLAVEYIRALRKTHSLITPVTLCREDNFNGAPQEFASSSALRGDSELRRKYTFDFVAKDIDDDIEEKYCRFATQFLTTMEKSQLENIADVTEGLHNRIFDADKAQGYEKMMSEIKTKRYTRAKLNRIVLNCVLNITKQDVENAKTTLPHITALAVKQASAQLLANELLSTSATDALTLRADRIYTSLQGAHQMGFLKI